MVNLIFFELCCARHYNCGSYWAVLVLSLLDKWLFMVFGEHRQHPPAWLKHWHMGKKDAC